MTPAEFDRRARYVIQVRTQRKELAEQRENREMYRTAWLVSTIMNFAGKQLKGSNVRPEELIVKPVSEEESLRKRRALVRRHRLDERFGIHAKPYGES